MKNYSPIPYRTAGLTLVITTFLETIIQSPILLLILEDRLKFPAILVESVAAIPGLLLLKIIFVVPFYGVTCWVLKNDYTYIAHGTTYLLASAFSAVVFPWPILFLNFYAIVVCTAVAAFMYKLVAKQFRQK